MDTVLLFQHVDTYGSRLRLEGLTAFAKEVGWTIQSYQEEVTAESLAKIKDFWRPVGTILSVNNGEAEFNADLFSPADTVLLDCFAPGAMERFTSVITDSSQVADIAARELLGTSCASYGFVPFRNPREWSENRRQNLARILQTRGMRLESFKPSRPGLESHECQKELLPWLRALPKPCGILAANDRVGVNVLNTCRLARISVPFECIVVGVDDNDNVCEGANPTLSSVGLDFKASGYKAGELLNELIHGRLEKRPIVSIPPIGFTRRNSSRVFLRADPCAQRASELIRAKACGGLEPQEVLSVFPCSRRLAEIRFREATGHSIGDEIRAVRIQHAKRLLSNPFQRLDAVAGECGYESDTTFRRVFKEETGLTLREWQLKAHEEAKARV